MLSSLFTHFEQTEKVKNIKGKAKSKISRYFRDPAPHGNHTINGRRAPHVRKANLTISPIRRGCTDADSVMMRAFSSSHENIDAACWAISDSCVCVCTDARLEGSLKAPFLLLSLCNFGLFSCLIDSSKRTKRRESS